MQQSETTTTTPIAPQPRLLDELREYARQHRDLARRNYESFTRQYGKPSDRVKEIRDRLQSTWARVRAEAREGYTKLDRDLEAKAAAEPAPVVVHPATNGIH